jgi:hypothetical protein
MSAATFKFNPPPDFFSHQIVTSERSTEVGRLYVEFNRFIQAIQERWVTRASRFSQLDGCSASLQTRQPNEPSTAKSSSRLSIEKVPNPSAFQARSSIAPLFGLLNFALV